MREIKFRAWDVEDKEFIFFDLYSVVGLRPEELDSAQQFTGLQDRNGVDVYEGDILSHPEDSGAFPVKYQCAAFMVYEQNTPCSGSFLCQFSTDMKTLTSLIVIGNIHETPELLEAP